MNLSHSTLGRFPTMWHETVRVGRARPRLGPIVRVAGSSPTCKQRCTGGDTTSSFQLLCPGRGGVRSDMQNHYLFLPASLTQINPHTFLFLNYGKFIVNSLTVNDL